jgi:hypothetical protein
MPRKPARGDAKAAEARSADPIHNPLLTDPEWHPDLKPLAEALSVVCALADGMARCYADMLRLKERRGLPKPGEWPDAPELQRARAHHDRMVEAARHDPALRDWGTVGPFIEPEWTVLMREWSGYYTDWCKAIATAKEAAKSPTVAALMDAGETRPMRRWTMQTIIDLDNLAGTLHPFSMGGVDGLGFVRCGLPPLPKDFRTHGEAVGKRIGELRSIPATAVPPTPTVSVSPDLLDRLQRAAAAVDPGAIDRAAERAAAKAVEAIETRDTPGIGGTGTDWKVVQGRLLAKRDRGEPYTSLRKLCAELGCSEATIRKAINKSETLKGWRARGKGLNAAPKATDLDAVVRDNTRQTTEPAPDDVVSDDEVNATMARLIDQARPDERAKLNALDDAARRELARMVRSQTLNNEPSPLESDKPGERSRRVKQYKRA